MARGQARGRAPKWFDRKPRLYARTTAWTTRYYHRKIEGYNWLNLLGLNTNFDDLHKKDGESPYLTNLRFYGEDEVTQRSQAMSRKGSKFLGGKVTKFPVLDQTQAESFLDMYEGKIIEWDLETTNWLSGMTIGIQNMEHATGYLKITLRDPDTQEELSDAVVDLSQALSSGFSTHKVRFMTPTTGPVIAALQIYDDVDNTDCAEPYEQRSVRILSTGAANHRYGTYENPNTTFCLREKAIEFEEGVGAPHVALVEDATSTIPRLIQVCSEKEKWKVYPAVDGGVLKLFRTKVSNGETQEIAGAGLFQDAKAVRFAQAAGFLYYVDGNSALKKINLLDWTVSSAVPLEEDITVVDDPAAAVPDLTAKPGASLIMFHNNRLFLSGWTDDPDRAEFSVIDKVGPKFDQYNEHFYSHNRAPEDTSCAPITALEDLGDTIVVFRLDGAAIFDAPAGLEYGSPQLINPPGEMYGVLNQEAVCKAKNNIYFYNPDRGVMRFGGSLSTPVSDQIDNILEAMPDKSKVFMYHAKDKVRMVYSTDGKRMDSTLLYYEELAGATPWYRDINTPYISVVVDEEDGKMYGLHSDYAVVAELETQFTDFSSMIVAEYHTQYGVAPDPATEKIVHRCHVTVLSNFTSSYYIGIDTDYKDRPQVWRKFLKAQEDEEDIPYSHLKNNAPAGFKAFSFIAGGRGRAIQVRVKHYCYKSRMELMSIGLEIDTKDKL